MSVPVKGGLFAWSLGSKVPLTPAILAGKDPWLSVAVGQDPETARVPLQSVPFALRAGACGEVLLARGLRAKRNPGRAVGRGGQVEQPLGFRIERHATNSMK